MLADLLGEWRRGEQEWARCWKETGAPPVAARAEEALVTVHSAQLLFLFMLQMQESESSFENHKMKR